MCELCSDDKEERSAALERNQRISRYLNELSTHYKRVASGMIKPHTDEIKKGELTAHLVIRYLVEDWI